jgi:hypothetical protein
MLTTVKDACELHPMALEYAMSEQIEHLSQLLDEHERDAEAFFDKNYVTHGMRELLRGGLQRLAGQSDQATFELRQAMGGGKTHSMLALGLLARNPHLRHLAPGDVTAGIDLPLTKVVAINGRAISDEIISGARLPVSSTSASYSLGSGAMCQRRRPNPIGSS